MANQKGTKSQVQKQLAKFAWNKTGENTHTTPKDDSTSSQPCPPAKELALQDVMEAIAGVRTSLEHRIDSVNIEVTLLRADFQKINTRVKDIEITTKALVSDTSTLQQHVAQLQDQHKKMEDLLDEYEGRSRRNNIRILGVPERTERPAVDLYVEDLVTNHLQPKRLSKYFSIERALRVPGRRPRPGAPPRPIIEKVFNFRDRDNILQTARTGPPLKIDGATITFFPDYTAKVQAKRRNFTAIKKALRENFLKYSMIFLANSELNRMARYVFFYHLMRPGTGWR